jgi:hypothetical protein
MRGLINQDVSCISVSSIFYDCEDTVRQQKG